MSSILQAPLVRTALAVHTAYRDAGGTLIAGGLAYATLFALGPTLALVVGGLYLLIDDPEIRARAIELMADALPALEGIVGPSIEGATRSAAVSSIVAIGLVAWTASGLYLALTRAMERFFPGERTSSLVARAAGVVLVLVLIVGVLAAVLVAGLVTAMAQALRIDAEIAVAVVGAIATLAVATGLVYGIYRFIPAKPPSPGAARLPAALVGLAIGLMTLLYGVVSPWLVASYAAFGVLASVFVALLWLRITFIALVYGAAMARHRDGVPEAGLAATSDG